MSEESKKRIHIRVHPEYERWRLEWTKAYDFLRGGLHVTRPAHAVTEVAFLSRVQPKDSDSDDLDRGLTESAAMRASYLFSHARESEYRWKDRNRRAEHIPVFKPIVRIFASALHQTPPTRTFDGKETLPDLWRSYIDDADLQGTGLDALMEGLTRWTLCFGRSHGLTDVPRPAAAAPQTLAEQESLGLRAYTVPLTPLQVVNWSLDALGRYRWVVLAEEAEDNRAPESEPARNTARRRIWYPDRWELYQPHETAERVDPYGDQDGIWELVETGRAPGRVPLSTYYADKSEARADRESDSPMASLLGVDLAVFNLLSQLDETELLSCFNQLAVEGDGGDVDAGEATVIYFAPGSRPPVYVAPPNETAQGKWERLVARINLIARQVLASRGRADFSKEERSAEALEVEYQDRYTMLSSLAGCAEDAEHKLLSDVGAWHGQAVVPRSAYQRRFDTRSISRQITDALGLLQLPVGAEAKIATLERIVEQVLKASGTPEEVRRRAVSGIKEAVREAADLQQQAAKAAQLEQPTEQP